MFGDRDNLYQRGRALQNKQRSGNVAPPTTPYTPSPRSLMLGTTRPLPSMDVPDFTPLGKRGPPPAKQRPAFPLPVRENALFGGLAKERTERPFPASLLAPRYSHLLEEAVAISRQETEATTDSEVGDGTSDQERGAEMDVPSSDGDVPAIVNEVGHLPPPPATIGKRVKGFLTSYLPLLAKAAPPNSGKASHHPRQVGLPLPPPDVLGKHRGPVVTPVRPPLPKPKHPKELVNLNPAPQPPPKTSMIPRAKKPQRLVELQPLPPVSPSKPIEVPRPRRSSSGSVKDLIRSFEDLEGAKKTELKRVKSNGDWKKTLTKGNKPTWRP